MPVNQSTFFLRVFSVATYRTPIQNQPADLHPSITGNFYLVSCCLKNRRTYEKLRSFRRQKTIVGALNVKKIISTALWQVCRLSAVLKLLLYAMNAAVCTQGLILLLYARLLNSINRYHILCMTVMEEIVCSVQVLQCWYGKKYGMCVLFEMVYVCMCQICTH